ncbi:MAG: tetratricopeptide repeat protein [Thermoanaerobaculia bacterium]|nr:tetratricopeptide repeat protein [Thermoanaerobaculia bacterium]
MKRMSSWTASFALILTLAGSADARDVYKGFIDPNLFAHHRAIADILQKLEEDPKNAALKNDLGLLIARDGFWRDAIREFKEAAELDPKIATKAYFNAGLVSLWKGDNGGARSFLKKSVDRDPGNWPAWWMLGLVEERLFNIDAALDAYKRSLRVDTSLFDPTKNPFAIESKLRSRVLLETYQQRKVRAAQPIVEQFADPERIQAFLQPAMAPATPPAPPAAAEPQKTPVPAPTPTPVPIAVPTVPSVSSPTLQTHPTGTKPPDVKPVEKTEPQPPPPPAQGPDSPSSQTVAPPPAPPAPGPGGPPVGFSDRPSNYQGSGRGSDVKGAEQGGPGPGGFDSQPPATPPPPQ